METKPYTAFVGFGSNIGEGRKTLLRAWKRLGEEDAITLTTLSSPFFSDPVGMESDNQFTNCVGRIETKLSPQELLNLLLDIEEEFGRNRNPNLDGLQDRTLDLDLLYYSHHRIVDQPDCIIPHPRSNGRLFVLVPMAEIEPTYVDPITGESMVSMCRRLYGLIQGGEIEEQKIKRGVWKDMSADSVD